MIHSECNIYFPVLFVVKELTCGFALLAAPKCACPHAGRRHVPARASHAAFTLHKWKRSFTRSVNCFRSALGERVNHHPLPRLSYTPTKAPGADAVWTVTRFSFPRTGTKVYFFNALRGFFPSGREIDSVFAVRFGALRWRGHSREFTRSSSTPWPCRRV